MVCFKPMPHYGTSAVANPSGKRGLSFNFKGAKREGVMGTLPCGRCIGCRFDLAEGWGIRCHHEAKMHPGGTVFVTLTFDQEHLPRDMSVRREHAVAFIKAIREAVKPLGGSIDSHFGSAEYGSLRGRPHFHFLLYGWNFPDRKIYKMQRGFYLYESALLSKAWPFGRALLGTVTFKSARYCAGYAMKKVGPKSKLFAKQYTRQSEVDGEYYRVEPEFAAMSRQPSLGHRWFDKFQSDVYPRDECIIEGHRRKPPRFYDKLLEARDPEAFAKLKRKRLRDALAKKEDRTKERLKVREELFLARVDRWERAVD